MTLRPGFLPHSLEETASSTGSGGIISAGGAEMKKSALAFGLVLTLAQLAIAAGLAASPRAKEATVTLEVSGMT